MAKPQKQQAVVAAPPVAANGAVAAQEGAADTTVEELPMLARMLNHLLTPGSSLTSSVWTAFNVIMVWLFACWLLFVFSFPDNIHVWAFFVLGVGLLLTTNWFMSEIFKAGLDYDSTKKAEAAKGKKDAKKAIEGGEKKSSTKGAVPDAKKQPAPSTKADAKSTAAPANAGKPKKQQQK